MDIIRTLEYLGFYDTGHQPAPNLSTYQTMVATWRHKTKQPPSEADMLAAWNIINQPKSDVVIDAEMDAATGVPEIFSILEAIAARLPGPVSVDTLRGEARARGRLNLPRT